MKIDKNYVNKLINEEYEKIVISELFSKRTASLEEIVDGDGNPSVEEVIKSDHFQKSLFSDIVSGKRNLSDWKVMQKSGDMNSLSSTDDTSFPIHYDFDFTYNYKGNPIPLTLIISGDVPVSWNGRHIPATRYQPAEAPEPSVDRDLGRNVEIHLYADGSEIPLVRQDGVAWMTPQIKNDVANSVLSPYL